MLTLNIVDAHDGFERLCPFLGTCALTGPLPKSGHRALMSMHHFSCALAARRLPGFEIPIPAGQWWESLLAFRRIRMLNDEKKQVRVFASAHEAGEFIEKRQEKGAVKGGTDQGRHVAQAARTGGRKYGHYWAYDRKLTEAQTWAPAAEYVEKHGDGVRGRTEVGTSRARRPGATLEI